ncbi:MAG: SUMF1/EgtB/PvdO family nonheme iron enzyme [Myxococcota bacterium]
MRPCWPLLSLPLLLLACDPCDEEILQAAPTSLASGEDPDAAADVLSEACKLPEPLVAWLDAPASPPQDLALCENGPTLGQLSKQPILDARKAAFEACNLSWLSAQRAFINADGYPLLAAAVAGHFRSEEADAALVTLAGDALRGQDLLPMPAERLPVLSGGQALDQAPPVAQQVHITADGVRINGEVVLVLEDGAVPSTEAPPELHRFSHHAVASLIAAVEGSAGPWYLLADKDVPADTLRRVSASLPGVLHLVGTEGWFASASFEVSETAPAAEGDAIADISAVVSSEGRLGLGAAPCQPAPGQEMACVGGADVQLGEHTVQVSTFYVDDAPITYGEYDACVNAGICARLRGGADEPVTNLSWRQAHRYCIWAGKRLPSEAEWLAASKYTAGSPIQEWTGDWGSDDLAECGADCQGEDPLGICDGAPRCKISRNKVIRGQGVRRVLRDARRDRAVGARCVADEAFLETYPPRPLETPPPDPLPLTEEQKQWLTSIPEDPIWEKPVCDANPGYVTLKCRDSMTYVRSNERRAWVWAPTIKNRGGAYIGVGSDQNYSHASLARAELIFLTDYDPDVVGLHYVNRALILKAETPQEFVRLYSYAARAEALEIIEETYQDHKDLQYFLAHYRAFQPQVEWYYRREAGPSGREVENRWLRNVEQYNYIRKMWQMGRIIPVKADLTGDNAMQGIAEVCRKMGVPVRILYTSNAPDNWSGRIVDGYRRNILGLPMDQRSLVLQTYIRSTGYGGPVHTHWHYNIQSGIEQQAMMARDGYTNVREFLLYSVATFDTDMTHAGLRGE